MNDADQARPAGRDHTGRSVIRVEDRPLLTGAATFTADVRDPALDGAAHVAFVRAPEAGARIERIDASDALTMPGVVGTLTGFDIDDPAPFSPVFDGLSPQPLLPRDVVGFRGPGRGRRGGRDPGPGRRRGRGGAGRDRTR